MNLIYFLYRPIKECFAPLLTAVHPCTCPILYVLMFVCRLEPYLSRAFLPAFFQSKKKKPSRIKVECAAVVAFVWLRRRRPCQLRSCGGVWRAVSMRRRTKRMHWTLLLPAATSVCCPLLISSCSVK